MANRKELYILGTTYSLVESDSRKDLKLTEMNGYCDTSVKRIVVDSLEDQANDLERIDDLDAYKKQLKRHEILHAFLSESGLAECSWAHNEEMVDWFAIQLPKICKVLTENSLF